MTATLPADKYPKEAAMDQGRVAPHGGPGHRQKQAPWADRLFSIAAHGAAWITLALLAGIILSLVVGAWPAIREYGLSFLWRSDWDPVEEKFGGLVMIWGTLATSFIALLIAVPVSFGIALFLTELSPGWLKRPLGTAIELLAAVPSIVYGMWGLMVFGPILATYVQQPAQSLLGGVPILGTLVSGAPVGIGILSAGIILAIMIIPFIASVMRDVFEVTPALLKESAYGLGATTSEVVWKVVLPYTKSGVISVKMVSAMPPMPSRIVSNRIHASQNRPNDIAASDSVRMTTFQRLRLRCSASLPASRWMRTSGAVCAVMCGPLHCAAGAPGGSSRAPARRR